MSKILNKLKNGFDKKQRTKAEIDADYSKEAVWLGHKTRMGAQVRQDLEKLDLEIQGHLDNLLALNLEGMKLSQEAPAVTPVEKTSA